MKSQYFLVRRAGFLFAGLCALAFTFAVGGTAQAQYPYPQDRDRDRDRNERDHDWQRRQRERERERERQSRVYDRNRDGIDDRYERNGGYGNNGGYYGRGGYGGYGGYGNNVAQIAADQGYRDGLNTGASDGQRGQNYDPQRSHYYRSGTDGYSSSYGNRSMYQQYFRDGFLRGYQEGYRQYGNGRYGRGYPTSRAGSILGNIFGRP